VAHLLIAVNPLKPLVMPEESIFEGATSMAGLQPHQYAIAEAAYRALLVRIYIDFELPVPLLLSTPL